MAGNTPPTKPIPPLDPVDYTAPIPSGWGPDYPHIIKTYMSHVPYTAPIPPGWGPLVPHKIKTDMSHVPHSSCVCITLPPVDPVYASASLVPGVGIGYNRSKVIICNTDNMHLNQPGEEVCPDRSSEYILHVNRLTENFPRQETKQ